MPLPPGEWHELARVTEEAEAAAVLVRLDGRDADAAVLVRVNRLGRKVGWGLSPPCLSRDYEPSRVLHASDHDGFCVYASYVDGTGPQTGVAIDAAWRQAMQAAVDRGWNVPRTWLSVTYRLVDPFDSMQVRYLFHPWPASEMKPAESTAWRRVQAERLTRWMDSATPVIGLGFRDRLRDGLGAELPDPALIETSENGAAPVVVPQGPPTWRAFTSRLSSALADFGVFWVFTGNPLTATAIAGSKFVAQGATGITHDALWSWLAAGPVTSDLPGAGAERPLPR